MVAFCLEQAAQKGRRAAELVFHIESLEVEHGRHAMHARPLASQLQPLLSVRLGVNYEMAEALGEGDEIAFRVDDALLYPGRTLLQQTA